MHIEKAREWSTAVAASIFGVVTTSFFSVFSDKIGVSTTIGVTLVVLFALVFLFQMFLDFAIDSFPFVRKLIQGRSFIEGCWIDHALHSDGKLISAALLHITYEERCLSVNGLVIWPESKAVGSLEGFPATLTRKKLTFSFEMHTAGDHHPVVKGYEELQFLGPGSCPNSYTGFIFDTNKCAHVTVHGRKVVTRDDIRRLCDPEDRLKYLRENAMSKSQTETEEWA